MKHLNILLADDDLDDCLFFRDALKELPISAKLSVVHDGEQLMDYLSENSAQLPDVLFLDLNMPRKNGLECLSEIKRNTTLKNLSVVIFSTSNSEESIKILFKRGANIYIKKPGDFTQLIEIIHHALPIAAENIFSNMQVKYILNA
jgi:CheY-like chemotaxis protein